MIALILGTLLALSALAYVLAPLFTEPSPQPVTSIARRDDSVQLVCAECGPRPEADASYCSTCGRPLGGPCAKCGAVIDQPGARYCATCGHSLEHQLSENRAS
jgi:predicted amidophosphoribosyltransferase